MSVIVVLVFFSSGSFQLRCIDFFEPSLLEGIGSSSFSFSFEAFLFFCNSRDASL